MKPIEVTTDGLNDLLKNIDTLSNTTLLATAAAMAKVSVDVANYAKATHPFQNRTENLENSIQPEAVEQEGGLIVGVVAARMEYAQQVEFGTSKSAPYPYMSPSIEANRDNLLSSVNQAIESAKQVIRVVK